MSRAGRLQPIAEIAAREADTAAQALAEARGRMEAERNRLRELEAYRDEYATRFSGSATVMRGGDLRDFHAFIGQLNQAIADQEQVLHRLADDMAQHEQAWREKHARAQAMDKVVEGHRRTERQHAERREQKAADEHAGRRHGGGKPAE